MCKSQGAPDKISDFSICNSSSAVKTNLTNKNNDNLRCVNNVKNSDKLVSVTLDVNKSHIQIGSCRTSQFDNKSETSLKRKVAYAMSTKKRPSKLNRSKSQQNVGNSFRQHNNESTSLVGKFVLPSRSLHSSRVIKPNKKFLNDEVREEMTKNCCKKVRTSENNISENDTNKKQEIASQEGKKAETTKSSPKETNTNTSQSFEDCKDKNDLVVIDSVSNSSSWSCGKLILRKARLQLHTQTSESGDGPFSNYSSSTVNPPGTVTCGVCGAVRFYRFVKQARKFNIYSCESCRKFISKMIKRQACAKSCSVPALVCHKGQGM